LIDNEIEIIEAKEAVKREKCEARYLQEIFLCFLCKQYKLISQKIPTIIEGNSFPVSVCKECLEKAGMNLVE